MKKHILMILLALLVSSGAFAQNLIPANGAAEKVVTENVNSGKHYSDGLSKHYLVDLDVSSYSDDDTRYLNKLADLIKKELGYPAVLYQIIDVEGRKLARFNFSGDLFTEFTVIKDYFDQSGFVLVDISGTLHTN